jgi:hypothetical protein
VVVGGGCRVLSVVVTRVRTAVVTVDGTWILGQTWLMAGVVVQVVGHAGVGPDVLATVFGQTCGVGVVRLVRQSGIEMRRVSGQGVKKPGDRMNGLIRLLPVQVPGILRTGSHDQ